MINGGDEEEEVKDISYSYNNYVLHNYISSLFNEFNQLAAASFFSISWDPNYTIWSKLVLITRANVVAHF